MDIINYLKQYTFLVLGIGYLLLFFGSIYGLIVSEVSIKFTSNAQYHIVLNGWVKNWTFGLGFLLAIGIASYPILSGLYKALSNANS
ncbi:hypothetical protein [Psychromonas sp. Urea-02u-13]|uniref:hypothetical protein n=1 Tax=Psychromonas sp. Urea-02u-13 TaxID=2058326 RepID=UPI000C332376|nr:hypothetical protein [Psychromonas sp. Urea-02u-13]PKG39800.1 hypothetical protein CXF74_06490 [Psychromonas sp. Urea-02u-13]